MKNRWIPILALIPVLLLATGCALWERGSEQGGPDSVEVSTTAVPEPAATQPPSTAPTEATAEATQREFQEAPEFTVYDGKGAPVSLSSKFGKPVVLNFWTSWCGPCKMEMPEFEALWQQLGEEVTFMMINVTTSENSQADAIALMEDLGYTFPVYYDLEGIASQTYGISAFPTTYFISAEGELIARAVGAIDSATILRGIEMAQS